MNWNLRTLRTRILSRAEVVEHFVPVHSELEHKTVEHFDPEHKTVEHMDPGPLQKLPPPSSISSFGCSYATCDGFTKFTTIQ